MLRNQPADIGKRSIVHPLFQKHAVQVFHVFTGNSESLKALLKRLHVLRKILNPLQSPVRTSLVLRLSVSVDRLP